MESQSEKSGAGQKVFTTLLTLLCAGFVYMEISGDPGKALNDAGVYAAKAETVPGLDGEQMFYDLGGAPGATPVVMFATPWCGVCRALEAKLKSRHVPFIVADVEKSEQAYRYYKVVIEQAASGVVPITVVGAQRFVGFVPEEIESAIQAYSKSSATQSSAV